MNFVMEEIKKSRRKYPKGDSKEVMERMLTLPKYLDLARRMINSFAPTSVRASMLASDDAIGYVAEKIMRGDWKFDPFYKIKTKISTHRGFMAQCAINQYMKKIARDGKNQMEMLDDLVIVPTDHPIESLIADEEKEYLLCLVKDLINRLTKAQKKCLRMYFMEDIKTRDIARLLDITPQAVQSNIRRGIRRIRKMVEELEDDQAPDRGSLGRIHSGR
jgi:RNA polymerase sigma factor (sigma-70 family)